MSCLVAAPVVAAGWAEADVIVVGEVHDNPEHHLYQAEIVTAAQPAAVVFEMLTPAQADAIKDMDRGDQAALAAALDWDASGWPDFAMYYPVFAASDAAVYGAALSRDDIEAAMAQGAAAVFGEDALQFGLTPLPDRDVATLSVEMQNAHCGLLPAEMLPAMIEAQRLRDAHFARVAAMAMDETGGPVVVITGNGHARNDRGMSRLLAQARPDLDVWSIGQMEGTITGDDLVYDETRVTPAIDRGDPCQPLGGGQG